MKVKTSELTGAALDWAVAQCEGVELQQSQRGWQYVYSCAFGNRYSPSTDGGIAVPIIDCENISIIRLEDESIADSKGCWQGKYEPRWGAVIGDKHGLDTSYGPQGDYSGEVYAVCVDAILGPTPLVAAMRCYVASKLGDIVDIPEELCIPAKI